jgi:NtrC-family two-component system response regulator AlgB
MHILLIDDDAGLRRSISLALRAMGHEVSEAVDGAEALAAAAQTTFDLALLDLRLASENGLDLLPQLLRIAPDLQVVVITAYATIETAVEAMRRGAFDYLPKPFTPDQLRVALERAERRRQQGPDLARLHTEVGGRATLEELEAEHIRRVLASAATIEQAAEILGIDPSTLYRKRKRYGL